MKNLESDLDFVRPVSSKVLQSGKRHFYRIHISLKLETCKFKTVKVFIIFRALNELGQIASSIPSPDLLQEGEFDRSFEIFFSTTKGSQEIFSALNEIMDIENKEVKRISVGEFKKYNSKTIKKFGKKEKLNEDDEEKNLEQAEMEKKIEVEREEKEKQPKEKKPPKKELRQVKLDPSVLFDIAKKIPPKLIFAEKMEGLEGKVYLSAKEFVEYADEKGIGIVFSARQEVEENSFILFTLCEGFLIATRDLGKIMEIYFSIHDHGFQTFPQFLEAKRLGCKDVEEYRKLAD